MKAAMWLPALLLAGCTTQNIKPDAALAPDEGILVTDIHCGAGVNWFEFHPTGSVAKGYLGSLKQAATVHCPVFGDARHAVRTIRLKEGRYFVGKVGQETDISFEEDQAVTFTVAAGRLNYIGDLRIQSMPRPEEKTIYVDLTVVDDESRVKAEVQRDFPLLAARLPWEKRLAQDRQRQ